MEVYDRTDTMEGFTPDSITPTIYNYKKKLSALSFFEIKIVYSSLNSILSLKTKIYDLLQKFSQSNNEKEMDFIIENRKPNKIFNIDSTFLKLHPFG